MRTNVRYRVVQRAHRIKNVRSIEPLRGERTFDKLCEHTFPSSRGGGRRTTAEKLSQPLHRVEKGNGRSKQPINQPIKQEERSVAIRHEQLEAGSAAVYRFPMWRVRSAAARERMLARRRRSATAASILAVILAALFMGGWGHSEPPSRPGAPGAVVLRPGQTLWEVAARYAPKGSDLRAYVYELERLNHLGGAPQAGARLVLPASP